MVNPIVYYFQDKDGFVAAADLREMMLNHPGSSSTKEIDELIEEADSNGDGHWSSQLHR